MINRVILRGFVADEPLIRATENGRFARLRIATIERLNNPKTGKIREHIEWHTVSFWGAEAIEVDKHVRVATPIEVEGALRTREWSDKANVTHKMTAIAATSLKILTQIEGYELPKSIVDKLPIDYHTCSKSQHVATPHIEVKAPAADPDDLPF